MPRAFANKAKGFNAPTQLPNNERLARKWQAANRHWWESAPMRYDWRDGLSTEPGTREYFVEIDRRFFASVSHYMPWKTRPFDNLIDFDSLSDKDVLEIGVGYGSHAQLIAPFCKSFTGIDLTDAASRMTAKRLGLFGIPCSVLQMDAERMAFPDASFDYIWTWGVVHHSADTRQVLKEMHRVLRPSGHAVVMVYHRSRWNYYVMNGFFKGILQGYIWRAGTLHHVSQATTDGAIARYYRPGEWRQLCEELFAIKEIAIAGQKSDVLPLPGGRLKNWTEKRLPDTFSRFLTNDMGMGSFLIVKMCRA